jgi:hypothetical protein
MNTTILQSDVFSFRRLYWFARKEILENWKVNLLSLVAILAVNVGYYAIAYQGFTFLDKKSLSTNDIGTNNALSLTVIIGVLFVADRSFHYFSTKPKTIAALTTPVSVIERMAWFIIYTFPIFISAAFVIWKCVSWLSIPIFKAAFPTLGTAVVQSATSGNSDHTGAFLITTMVLLLALGGIALGRVSFLKTLAITIAAYFGLTALNSLFIRYLLANKPTIIFNSNTIFTPTPVFVWQGSITKSLESSYENVGQYWLYCLPVLLLVTIYFKIKDKEV